MKESREMLNFREYSRAERERQGLSRKKLAEKAGCSEMAIYYWETGRREIPLRMADQILKVLGTSMRIGTE